MFDCLTESSTAETIKNKEVKAAFLLSCEIGLYPYIHYFFSRKIAKQMRNRKLILKIPD